MASKSHSQPLSGRFNTSRGEGSNRSKRKATGTPSTATSLQEDAPISPSSSSKVAIPWLQFDDISAQDAARRDAAKVDRTYHACEPCRTRKTKCSGETPTCKHCRQFNISCVYADGKRDKVKRHQERMDRKIALYEALLLEAGPAVGPHLWSRFQRARSPPGDAAFETGESLEEVDEQAEPLRFENHRSASEGSMDNIDSVGENITKDAATQAAGFFGKASQADWQRGINEKEDRVPGNTQQQPAEFLGSNASVSSMSYQINHTNIPGLGDPNLKTYAVPAPQTASYLTGVFYKKVYPSFPLLPRFNFEFQLSRAYNGNFMGAAKPNERWRAIMNLVFAIGARYLQITDATLPMQQENHEVFFARAARLGLIGKTLLELADLQQIQIYGLASFYLTSINHMNRAWMLAGLAVRTSIALGLQVELKTDELDEYAKESRYRLWWAIYGLDTMLQIMTGRPAAISLYGFSTPLPVPYDEQSFDPSDTSRGKVNMSRFTQSSYREGNVPNFARVPNIARDAPEQLLQSTDRSPGQALADVELSDSLYFIFRARLCLIVHEVLQTLYQPASAHFVWSQVQSGIDKFNRTLENWQSSLPSALDFRSPQADAWVSNRNALGVFYYTVRILANRPCLCEMAQGATSETTTSQEFNKNSATICVESAIDILQIMPRDLRTETWAAGGPWWSTIHYVFSAVTVLTIELFYQSRHVGKEREKVIIQEAKHGIRWLHALAKEPNEGAERAWRIVAMTLARITTRLGIDLSDVPLPPEALNRTQEQPSQPDEQSHYGLPFMDLSQSTFLNPAGFNPSGYPDLGATTTADIGWGENMFSYPGSGGSSYEIFGVDIDAQLASAASYAQQMPSQMVDPHLDVQAGASLEGVSPYPSIPMQMSAQQSRRSWQTTWTAVEGSQSTDYAAEDEMDIDQTVTGRQRAP